MVKKELPQTYNYLVDFKILQLKLYLLKGLFIFLKTLLFCLFFILGGSSSSRDPLCGVCSFLVFLLKMNTQHLTAASSKA